MHAPRLVALDVAAELAEPFFFMLLFFVVPVLLIRDIAVLVSLVELSFSAFSRADRVFQQSVHVPMVMVLVVTFFVFELVVQNFTAPHDVGFHRLVDLLYDTALHNSIGNLHCQVIHYGIRNHCSQVTDLFIQIALISQPDVVSHELRDALMQNPIICQPGELLPKVHVGDRTC